MKLILDDDFPPPPGIFLDTITGRYITTCSLCCLYMYVCVLASTYMSAVIIQC